MINGNVHVGFKFPDIHVHKKIKKILIIIICVFSRIRTTPHCVGNKLVLISGFTSL